MTPFAQEKKGLPGCRKQCPATGDGVGDGQESRPQGQGSASTPVVQLGQWAGAQTLWASVAPLVEGQ